MSASGWGHPGLWKAPSAPRCGAPGHLHPTAQRCLAVCVCREYGNAYTWLLSPMHTCEGHPATVCVLIVFPYCVLYAAAVAVCYLLLRQTTDTQS